MNARPVLRQARPAAAPTGGRWERSGTCVRVASDDPLLDGELVADCGGSGDWGREESEANADVMAQAKALLAAVQELLPLHISMLVLHRNRGCRCEHCESVARACAAVVEATGDTSFLLQGGPGPSGAHNPDEAGSTPAPATNPSPCRCGTCPSCKSQGWELTEEGHQALAALCCCGTCTTCKDRPGFEP